MTNYCPVCDTEYDCKEINCPVCGKKLIEKYTQEELEEIKRQNDDFTVINTLLL